MAVAKKTELEETAINVNIDELCSHMGLEIINIGETRTARISTFNINRPGLQLADYYEHFSDDRVQVIGEQEVSYLSKLTEAKTRTVLEKLFAHNFPFVVLSSGLKASSVMVDCAKKTNTIILSSKLRSTMIINELSIFLNEALAPKETIHGVLMDLYGVGVLITGKSSIGKSETALELVQRGHRLIADDAVCIKRISDRLEGTSPPIIKHFMEVRGIGIIDVKAIYGSGSVKDATDIDLVVALEEWNSKKEYNRLGNDHEVFTLHDIDVPMHTVPVKPGRNLAVIMEVAARNARLKAMGHDTLKELEERMKNRPDDMEKFDFNK